MDKSSKLKILPFIFLSIVSSAQSTELISFSDAEKDIQSLKTKEEILAYWVSVDKNDQTYRGCMTNVVNDVNNAIKVYWLIQIHGYPSEQKYGSQINSIPEFVYRHQPWGHGLHFSRKLLYPFIVDAFKKGIITTDDFGLIAMSIPCEFTKRLLGGKRTPDLYESMDIIDSCDYNLSIDLTNADSLFRNILNTMSSYMPANRRGLARWKQKNYIYMKYFQNQKNFIFLSRDLISVDRYPAYIH